MPVYLTQAGSLALQASGISGLGTSLSAGAIDICSAVPAPPDRQAVIGDFTLAAFTGYTEGTFSLTGGYVNGTNGLVYALSALLSFAGPSSGAGVDAVGFVIQNHAKTAVLAWGTFAAAVPLQVSTDLCAFNLAMDEQEVWTLTQVAPAP